MNQKKSNMLSDILSSRNIEHVVVLGANGTMGYGSGALFTRAVPKVTFLARTAEKAQSGLDAAMKQVRSPTVGDVVEVGSYEDDFDAAVASADLIFEAVTEKLDLKHEFFERIDRVRRPDSIVATVTSGLSINALAAPRSESFRKNFLGLHFFNPPNVIVGTELIAGDDTDASVVEFVEAFSSKRLGREMVPTYDAPGFAGNRVGFKVLNEVAQLAEEHGPLLMDKLVGRYTGRALAPLATIDLVGWDIHAAIVDNIHTLCPDDESRAMLAMPDYMRALMDKGTLGRKTGGGFFARDGRTKLVLNPKTSDYVPASEIELPDLSFIDDVSTLHHVGRYREAMAVFASAGGPWAALARKVIAGYIAYSFARVGEATKSIREIDRIMGHGFNWAPPSVLVDTLGADVAVNMVKEAGIEVPELLARIEKGEKLFNEPNVDTGKYFIASA